MSAWIVVGAGILGGAGAVARVLLAGALDRRHASGLPLGILAVNVAGAFALGLLAGAAAGPDVLRLAGTGFLGALTTFSTWMADSHRLGPRRGAANLGVALILGLAAVWLGREVGALVR